MIRFTRGKTAVSVTRSSRARVLCSPTRVRTQNRNDTITLRDTSAARLKDTFGSDCRYASAAAPARPRGRRSGGEAATRGEGHGPAVLRGARVAVTKSVQRRLGGGNVRAFPTYAARYGPLAANGTRFVGQARAQNPPPPPPTKKSTRSPTDRVAPVARDRWRRSTTSPLGAPDRSAKRRPNDDDDDNARVHTTRAAVFVFTRHERPCSSEDDRIRVVQRAPLTPKCRVRALSRGSACAPGRRERYREGRIGVRSQADRRFLPDECRRENR